MGKIAVYNFPYYCWKCKSRIQLTYPTTEEVYASELRGNLSIVETLPKDQNLGNICPDCKSYQGNFYVWIEFANHACTDLEKYFVGFIEEI